MAAPILSAGMFLGAGLVGVHMASTHGISLAMLSSYIPATPIPGLGRVSGTAWSFTDFILGALRHRPTHKRPTIAKLPRALPCQRLCWARWRLPSFTFCLCTTRPQIGMWSGVHMSYAVCDKTQLQPQRTSNRRAW